MKLILASKSPRRQELLKKMEFDFEIRTIEVEEIYPKNLKSKKIPEYLAKLKATPFQKTLKNNELLLTSDTVVILKNQVLGKPKNKKEAFDMLLKLSDKKHKVITSVALTSTNKQIVFSDTTKVYFDKLSINQINHYVKKYKPFDKAGSYGIQEWIGYVGIKKIKGCYFNVMGLPLKKVYDEIKIFNTKKRK